MEPRSAQLLTIGGLMVALVLLGGHRVAAAGDDDEPGIILGAWHSLLESGCDIELHGIATPLEARVLRNTPYAVAGKTFRSKELTILFSTTTWYKPRKKAASLSDVGQRCVARLKKHERKLRRTVKLAKKLEAQLTAIPIVYRTLREIGFKRMGKKPRSTCTRRALAEDGEILWGLGRCDGDAADAIWGIFRCETKKKSCTFTSH